VQNVTQWKGNLGHIDSSLVDSFPQTTLSDVSRLASGDMVTCGSLYQGSSDSHSSSPVRGNYYRSHTREMGMSPQPLLTTSSIGSSARPTSYMGQNRGMPPPSVTPLTNPATSTVHSQAPRAPSSNPRGRSKNRTCFNPVPRPLGKAAHVAYSDPTENQSPKRATHTMSYWLQRSHDGGLALFQSARISNIKKALKFPYDPVLDQVVSNTIDGALHDNPCHIGCHYYPYYHCGDLSY
jgi:hypothetical protein